MEESARRVLSKYSLRPISIRKISVGLINETYEVETEKGFFTLQKLNGIYNWGTIANVAAVGEFLNSHRLAAPTVVKTKDGSLGVEEDKDLWRLMTFIPGRIFEKVHNPELAYKAGKLLGRFHSIMRNFTGQLHDTPKIHDTLGHFNKFLDAMPEEVQEPEIKELKKEMFRLPSFFMPKTLSPSITHGDPKITNIVFYFNGCREQAKTLIDLDGCSRQNPILIELGDAFRSWCAGNEDDGRNVFDLAKFKAAIEGYLEDAGEIFTATEADLLPQAIKLITLELASRFLRDYWEDKYFGWDASRYTSRKVHNLARAKGQVSLFSDFLKKEGLVVEIVRKHTH